MRSGWRLASWACSLASREGSTRTTTLLTSTREGDGCTGSSARSPADGTSSRNPLAGRQTCGDRFAGKVERNEELLAFVLELAHMEHGSTYSVGRSVGTDSGT
jgi:hypothetical protein